MGKNDTAVGIDGIIASPRVAGAGFETHGAKSGERTAAPPRRFHPGRFIIFN
jgi:hypothetical protein